MVGKRHQDGMFPPYRSHISSLDLELVGLIVKSIKPVPGRELPPIRMGARQKGRKKNSIPYI